MCCKKKTNVFYNVYISEVKVVKLSQSLNLHQRATDDLVESGLEQQASAAMNIFKGRYAALGTLLNY